MKSEKIIMKWLKEYGPSILITFIIAVFVFLAQFPYWAGIVSFVFADCVIGYWYKNKIICDKAKLKAQAHNATEESEKKFFNSEYYDLYYEFNYNQLMLILKAVCLAFSLCPILCDLIGDTISYLGTGMTLAVVFLGIAAIASISGKRSKVLLKLRCERKENWFGEYTEKELAILGQSKECGEKTTNK